MLNCFQNLRIGILRDPFWNPQDSSLAAIIPEFENILDIINTTGLANVVDNLTIPFQYRIDRQQCTVI